MSHDPDSVLISLRNLRRLENERVQHELDEQERAAAEQLRASEEAERLAREAAEHAAREEAERLRREQERLEERRRADELHLAEAHQRARVEAELQLERERVRLELASRPPRPSAAAWVPAVLAVAFAGAALFLAWEWRGAATERRATSQHLDDARQELGQRGRQLQLTEAQLLGEQQRVAQLRREVEALRSRPSEAPPRPGPTAGVRPPRRDCRSDGRACPRGHYCDRGDGKCKPQPSVIPASCKDSVDPIGCLETRGRRE